jgi:hypothetical protein
MQSKIKPSPFYKGEIARKANHGRALPLPSSYVFILGTPEKRGRSQGITVVAALGPSINHGEARLESTEAQERTKREHESNIS